MVSCEEDDNCYESDKENEYVELELDSSKCSRNGLLFVAFHCLTSVYWVDEPDMSIPSAADLTTPITTCRDNITQSDLTRLAQEMHVKTACHFLSQRAPDATRAAASNGFKMLAPKASPAYGNGRRLYRIALSAFNNMRYTFNLTVKQLALTYSSKHSR